MKSVRKFYSYNAENGMRNVECGTWSLVGVKYVCDTWWKVIWQICFPLYILHHQFFYFRLPPTLRLLPSSILVSLQFQFFVQHLLFLWMRKKVMLLVRFRGIPSSLICFPSYAVFGFRFPPMPKPFPSPPSASQRFLPPSVFHHKIPQNFHFP